LLVTLVSEALLDLRDLKANKVLPALLVQLVPKVLLALLAIEVILVLPVLLDRLVPLVSKVTKERRVTPAFLV